jgi:hypothetical protein
MLPAYKSHGLNIIARVNYTVYRREPDRSTAVPLASLDFYNSISSSVNSTDVIFTSSAMYSPPWE